MVTIYNVIPEDEGVYSCRDGDTQGGIVIIEVVDTENYTVVSSLNVHFSANLHIYKSLLNLIDARR